MSQGLEPIYDAIGGALQERLPPQWDVSWALHEIARGGVTQCKGFVQRERDGEAEQIALDPRAHQAFNDLAAMFQAAGKPLWRLAQFTLTPGGTFEMGFQYEDGSTGEAPSIGGSRSGY